MLRQADEESETARGGEKGLARQAPKEVGVQEEIERNHNSQYKSKSLRDQTQYIARRLLVVILLALGLLVIFWAILANEAPAWTGFGPYDEAKDPARAKTLWDWLDLLIVSAVLAAGGILLNRSARRREQRIADDRREQEQRIANDNRNQATLQAYYDRMADLILTHNLKDEKEGRSIARARTLATLRSLDGERKGSLLRFLYESELLGSVDGEGDQQERIVSLSRADLSGANLSWADLSEADLSFATLDKAKLSEATLNKAKLNNASLFDANLSRARVVKTVLSGAELSGAKLSGAKLSGADLRDAYLMKADLGWADLRDARLGGAGLYQADLRRADLRKADLTDSNLFETDLREANLRNANLRRADLRKADLGEADLSGAILSEANLSGADLVEAILFKTDLSDADLSEADLSGAIYDHETTWPNNFDPEQAGFQLQPRPVSDMNRTQ